MGSTVLFLMQDMQLSFDSKLFFGWSMLINESINWDAHLNFELLALKTCYIMKWTLGKPITI
jgi:hypothetical protein